MSKNNRKRRCRPQGNEVPVLKKAEADLEKEGGKLNPAQGVLDKVRPKEPFDLRVISVKEVSEKAFHLREVAMAVASDTAARIYKGELREVEGAGEYLVTTGNQALGTMTLEKGVIVDLAKFSEPIEIEKAEAADAGLSPASPIEGMPIQELLDSHWKIHKMWMLKLLSKDQALVKDLTIEDITNVHARIVDSLLFRGVTHPHPPDVGLDQFSSEFERFADSQPRHFENPSKGGQIPVTKKLSDPRTEAPKENGEYRFVLQNHHTGNNVSTKLRLGIKPDELLVGWGLRTVDEAQRKLVTTLRDAKEFAEDQETLVDWETGAWTQPKLLADEIEPHPWVWLDVQGATAQPDPESGFMPPGSAWEHPGVFYIVDKGLVEFGLQSSGFHEYFLKGDSFNYRLVLETIEWEKERKLHKSEEGFKLPPEDQDRSGGGIGHMGGGWTATKMDPKPEVLRSKSSMMPAEGMSALPKVIREQIPAKFHYWMKEHEEAKALRDKLITAISGGKVAIDFTATFKKTVQKRSLADARFVQQGWTTGEDSNHVIRVDVGRDEHLVMKAAGDWGSTVEVEVEAAKEHAFMSLEGDMRPSHYLNKAKTATAHIQKIDSGKATVMSLTESFIRINFQGETLKGVFDVRKSDGNWAICSSPEAPSTSTPGDFVNILKFEDGGEEERLVTGIVLEPDEIDAQNDTIKAQAIRDTAHGFLAKFNLDSKMGIQHETFGEIGVKLVESFIAPVDMVIGNEKVKKGSWVITVKVLSDVVWEAIKDGSFTGFSIGGTATVA